MQQTHTESPALSSSKGDRPLTLWSPILLFLAVAAEVFIFQGTLHFLLHSISFSTRSLWSHPQISSQCFWKKVATNQLCLTQRCLLQWSTLSIARYWILLCHPSEKARRTVLVCHQSPLKTANLCSILGQTLSFLNFVRKFSFQKRLQLRDDSWPERTCC